MRVGKLVPVENSGTFNRHVRKLSGLDRFHAHQTRHTFGCQWVEVGGTLLALKEIMGHAKIETTLRYARLSDAHVKAEAERIAGKVAAEVATTKMQRVDVV